jgi:TPR repeat protein
VSQKTSGWFDKRQTVSKTRAICHRQSLSKRLWRYENYSKYLLWLRRPADLGHPPAQHLLGDMHRRGLGVALNYGEAKKWYKRAAEQGILLHNILSV